MSSVTKAMNATNLDRFQRLFRPRDIFLHDGSSLRRITIGSGIQLGVAFLAIFTLAFSLFAAFQIAHGSATLNETAVRRAEVARMEGRIAALQATVDAKAAALEQRQALLSSIASARYEATAAELRRLGLNPKRYQGVGGPSEALAGDKAPLQEGDPQFRALFMSWKKLDALEQGVISIPTTKPVASVSFTSGFGVRSDPFRGGAAMHAGIDLAGPVGTPVYATADGVVGRAEWANGYGNLVELEHGKGIQTRYGHLSKILVKANTGVKRGQLIALMGSTGRSTGSHLHYEVRIDGRAVNPVPFLQSSDYLLAVQRRAAATQIALGGPED